MAVASSFRRLPAALWRLIAPTNTRRVLALCSAFSALLAAGLYYTHELATAQPPAAVHVTALATDDPVAKFSKTGVGQLLYASDYSDSCRRVLFDNRTGALYDGGRVFCGQQVAPSPTTTSSDRMTTLRKAFQQ